MDMDMVDYQVHYQVHSATDSVLVMILPPQTSCDCTCSKHNPLCSLLCSPQLCVCPERRCQAAAGCAGREHLPRCQHLPL